MGKIRKVNMSDAKNMSENENYLNGLYVQEPLDSLILSLVGMSNTPINKLTRYFDYQDKINIPDIHFTNFGADDLAKLPSLNLNIDRFEADTTWELKNETFNLSNPDVYTLLFRKNEDNSDEMLTPSNLNNYTNLIQQAVDNIFPNNDDTDGSLIPVTILLPNSVPQEGEELEGKYSYWEFIKLNNESDEKKLGFQDAVESEETFFGLRFFLALKTLGLVNTNHSERNHSNVFLELLQSTPMRDHFKLLETKKIKEYTKLTKELAYLDNERKKLIKSKVKQTKKLNEINESVKKKSNEINDMNLFKSPDDAKSGFYYSLPIENLLHLDEDRFDLDPDEDFVLPTLSTSLESPDFKTNKLVMDKDKPSPLFTRRMRFMLAYLFPMTCGTSITFYIKKESYKQKIRGPLLILPESWNELALALKSHNPKEKLSDNNEEDELKFRESCIRSLYAEADGTKTEYMRCMVPISDTSGKDAAQQR